MSAGQLRGVIFDMDGVLVDSHAAHRKAWRIFFRTLEREVPETELDFILDGRKRGDILRHFLGDCPEPELEEFGRRKDCIFRQMQLEVRPLPGAVRMVRELHRSGMALALATSASRSRARSTLAELGLLNCFQAVVTGEEVHLGKPDASIYRLAWNRIEIEPEFCWRLKTLSQEFRRRRARDYAALELRRTRRPKTLRRQARFMWFVTSIPFPYTTWNAFCSAAIRHLAGCPGRRQLNAKALVAANLHDREAVRRSHLA